MPKSARLVVLLLLTCATATLAAAAPGDPVTAGVPPNIDIPGVFQADVRSLLAQSATLRRQCARIGAARDVHVTVHVILPPAGDARARASFAWPAAGRLEVLIEVPLGRDFPELIAHEFEHVLEQIEGVDLASLAGQPRSGVSRALDGTYETARARLAGRETVREIETSQAAPIAALRRVSARVAR